MVKVTHDGEPPTEPKERCCFCRIHTSYWYELADIACCEVCAKVAEPGDFPTKAQWCRRERIAENINRPFGR